MGMITRVRHRVRATSLTIDKEKTAQTVCLLSALLLLPYCPRSPLPLLPSPATLLYSAFVLPVVFTANYSYPLTTFKPVIRFIQGTSKSRLCHLVRRFSRVVYRPIGRAEDLFLGMKNMSVMVNQIVFLLLADRVILPRQQKMTCLYTLMFYNVTAYCVSYVKELIGKEDWSPYVTLTERSKIKHLAMSATKIVLEWTKAVTFVVTLTFMLLVFGLEQGLQHYRPSMTYAAVTWTFYAATERVFVEMFPRILASLRLEALENMENLYAPVLLRCLTIGLSVMLILCIVSVASWRFLVVACYLNVYLAMKELLGNSGATLKREQEVLSRYRKATSREIERFDDVCPVCLCAMSKARVTPCRHLFHGDCLRQCLKSSNDCPMCKRELAFS